MANLSDAGVDIVVEKVGKELVDYINATNDNTTDYAIVYEGFDEHINANGDLVISGSSSGRWAYANNLEGYFDPEKVKGWLGVGTDYAWLDDEAKKAEYTAQSNKGYEAYLALIEAIKKTGGRVEINYTDCDPAMGWMSTGGAVLEVEDGEVVFLASDESETLTISGYAEQQGEDERWALEYLHGDEAAEAYDKYLEKCEGEQNKPVSADTWYDELYEEE